MLPSTNKGAGMNQGFPDVCLTPAAPSPIPIPYPNMAMHALAAPFCPTILLSMVPALNMGSMIPMTIGDDAGVAHPMFKQMGMFTMGNPKVFLQGLPAITLTSPTTGNNMNNPVGLVSVPSVTTVLFTSVVGEQGAATTLHELIALADRLKEQRGLVLSWERGVLTIGIRVFARGTASAVHDAITRAARGGGISTLVFDVRGNPGGELSAAIELLRDLLPGGTELASVVDDDGDAVTHVARGDLHRLPMVVLVDANTASAAEVFARCLDANGRARVLGGPMHGKMTAQAITVDEDGHAVARTVARVTIPGGAKT